MKNAALEKPGWLAPGLRLILVGLVTLLLLCAPAWEQSGWPPGVLQTSHQKESEVRRVHLSSPNLRSAARGRENPGEDLGKPSARQDLPWHCPLPPASVFSLQTNLRKYLETWPTPGSTTTEAWPEYVPEDGEGRD